MGDDRDEGPAPNAGGPVGRVAAVGGRALRVLDAVRLEPGWLDDTGSVREVLAEVAKDRHRSAGPVRSGREQRPAGPGPGRSPPDSGLIADLLAGQPPARTEADRAAVAALQANVVAIVHAVAVATTVAAIG